MRRCLFGHVLVNEDGRCVRCHGTYDYDEGIKGTSQKIPTKPLGKPLIPIHHAKKNIGHKGVRYY